MVRIKFITSLKHFKVAARKASIIMKTCQLLGGFIPPGPCKRSPDPSLNFVPLTQNHGTVPVDIS